MIDPKKLRFWWSHKQALMKAFVRDPLGDARSFSLDSPESRKPRIEFL